MLNVSASRNVIPESDLMESTRGTVTRDVADVEFEDDQAVVANVATFLFTVLTGQAPNVKITRTGPDPFLFYSPGTEVLLFAVPAE